MRTCARRSLPATRKPAAASDAGRGRVDGAQQRYLHSLDDFRALSCGLKARRPSRCGDVAHIQLGPEMRRGIGELDGEGEAVGGVVILRSGKNARTTIAAVTRSWNN